MLSTELRLFTDHRVGSIYRSGGCDAPLLIVTSTCPTPIEHALAAWYPPTPVHHHGRPTMPQPYRRHHHGPKPDRRRALELLAASPDGCTEALMFANGFTAELLLDLVRAGLVSAHAERMVDEGKMMEVARIGITDEGWRLLEGDAVTTRREEST